jgi:quercetin 2,3-dioxygenase
MNINRKVKQISKSKPTLEGAGVQLKRAFGNTKSINLDPFLLLDDFHSNIPDEYLPGFPWHPHRGIETITYVLHGQIAHGDSMGNEGIIYPGDVQWMTAGSGIIHQEMPKGQEDGLLWGFQLWANLPAKSKMMMPRYQGILDNQIPTIQQKSGAIIRLICGTIENVHGPVQNIVIDPEYLDVTVPKHTTFTHSVRANHTVFAYVIEGNGYFDDRKESFVNNESLVIFDKGDSINISTNTEQMRFLLISGKPLNEPIAWYGPIVMNTQEELDIAFSEYQAGTFLKHKITSK